MKPNFNPFSNHRREGEGNSPIFFYYHDAANWFSNTNYIFEGLRGTGKTSILSAFNYEFVWCDISPIVPAKQLKTVFEGKPNFLGVIYKCENQDKDSWDFWTNKNEEIEAQYIYTTYLNYYFAEKFVEAVENVLKNLTYQSKEDKEYQFIKKTLDIAFPITELKPKIVDFSLYSLRIILANIHNSIRQELMFGTSFNILKESYCFHENCSLIQGICKLIKEHFTAFNDALFFPLIDDVNRLTRWQLKCINSMLICFQYPISFKISCAYGLYKTKESRDQNRPLGNSDVNIVYLGYDEDPTKISKQKDVVELLEVIFNSRIKTVYPKIEDFKLDSVFGKEPDLNELLINVLKKSEKTTIRKLYDDYVASKEKYFTNFWIDKEKIRILNQPAIENNDKLIKRKRNSELYNKFRQTATFCIINHYNLGNSFEYSSLDIIKHLICGSVRRFLKICEDLWPEIQKQIEKNSHNLKITPSTQATAIRKCSDHVYLGIDDRTLKENADTSYRKICDRFAKLFTLFISYDSLKITTECLSLKVMKKNLKSDILNYVDSIILYEAFIKIDFGDYFLIGLHPILSPRYGLPYRSPFYYYHSISEVDFTQLIEKSDKEVKEIERRIFESRINHKEINNSQPSLFDNE